MDSSDRSGSSTGVRRAAGLGVLREEDSPVLQGAAAQLAPEESADGQEEDQEGLAQEEAGSGHPGDPLDREQAAQGLGHDRLVVHGSCGRVHDPDRVRGSEAWSAQGW